MPLDFINYGLNSDLEFILFVLNPPDKLVSLEEHFFVRGLFIICISTVVLYLQSCIVFTKLYCISTVVLYLQSCIVFTKLYLYLQSCIVFTKLYCIYKAVLYLQSCIAFTKLYCVYKAILFFH